MKDISQIRIRDPFILTDTENKCYYMYGTTALKEGIDAGNSFTVYKSYDLKTFDDGKIVFHDETFWADRDFWAAEAHKFNGKYYLFASFKADGKCRGTQFLVCDTPDGKFVPVTSKPIKPSDWECLDGTLYVENDRPYLVFCREWLQVGIGEIYEVELSHDLKRTVGEPQLLFKADDSPLIGHFSNDRHRKCMITDAPFIIKGNSKLIMIWSSLSRENKYCVAQAVSGSKKGEWIHSDKLVFSEDGGHSMIFSDLNGKLKIALHQPNVPPCERAKFFDIEIINDEIRIIL